MKLLILLPMIVVFLFSCQNTEQAQRPYTAFTGATLIDGSGKPPVPNAVLLIQDGRVVAAGSEESVDIPENTTIKDVAGKTIIPGIINAHGHVGNTKGIEGGHYSRENIIDNLKIYARYGITTVVSLGDDREDAVALRAVNDSTAGKRARLFIAGEVIAGKTIDEAIAAVNRNHVMGVDFMKIRVDDNLGAATKMPEQIYRAVINRSHELGYRIATHLYYLEDARKLLEAGSDLIAHSVRDLPVDDAFIRLIREKRVGYCPTLTREVSTFVYADTADFFSDPFFTREYDARITEPLMDPVRQLEVRNSRSAMIYKQQLPVAMRNLKTLADAGIPIIFGTDSGVPLRFMGYFEHLELELMAQAGLTPMQIIVSASKAAAGYMGLKDLGTLTGGHWADFLVLDDDPLKDIRNIRKISAVYVGGEEIVH